MDFGDLKDVKVQEKIQKFHDSINKIEDILNNTLSPEAYERLSTKDKVDYDLFLAYTLNTLYWLFLRSKGDDPNKEDVKNQLTRVKDYMMKAKQAHERNTIRPKIDQPAAARFVKHGIQYRDESGKPPNKKIKFDDDGQDDDSDEVC